MLEARAISKRFGGQVVLRGVDLTVAPGEVVGLVGLNGSGKTTLLDILSGKVPPDAGEIWIDGKRVKFGRAFAARLPLFRSYQVPRLFYGLSVADNVFLGRWALATRGGSNDTGISSLNRGSSASTLSIGQRRRVIFDWVRARIGRNKYLLLDEPAAGGDEALVDLLQDLLTTARKQGCGVLLIEHRDGILKSVCDRIVYLRDGVCSKDANANGIDPVSLPPTLIDRDNEALADPQLIVSSLAVARGGALVLSGISLKLNLGDVAVVTGPNGCGKSTLLRALYGDPSCSIVGGFIASKGHSLAALSPRERMAMGMHLMPQDGTLFASMTVEEALRTSVEAAMPRAWNVNATIKLRREIIILDRIWFRKCGLLSGGERRIVSLARILLLRPRMALLDEPLAGVDREGTLRVGRLIGQLAEAGAAIIVAEQEALVSLLPATKTIHLRATPTADMPHSLEH